MGLPSGESFAGTSASAAAAVLAKDRVTHCRSFPSPPDVRAANLGDLGRTRRPFAGCRAANDPAPFPRHQSCLRYGNYRTTLPGCETSICVLERVRRF